MSLKLLFGFHAVTVRLKVAPKSIRELHVDATRRDQRMKQFLAKVDADKSVTKTASGLRYKILAPGSAEKPTKRAGR